MSVSDDTCIVYLIRHGATDNNIAVPPRLQGRRTDPGLSDPGRQQARRTAELLSKYTLGAVFTSPLRRARETAEIIAAPHGVRVEPDEAIIECDVGDWEGRSWEEIERAEPEAYRRFMDDPATHPYTGGESFGQTQERVVLAIERLMEAHLGERIVVVGHNIVNRTYLAWLLGIPTAKARIVSQDNCGVNVVRYRNGRMHLRTCNMALHLDEEH